MFAECSKTFVGLRDTIESEGFPSRYPIDSDCLWRIKLPDGYRIVINFHSFSLRSYDPAKECTDYLDILENGKGKDTTFKGRYCGSHNPGEIRLDSNEATIHLHTAKGPYQRFAAGFSASYRAEGKSLLILTFFYHFVSAKTFRCTDLGILLLVSPLQVGSRFLVANDLLVGSLFLAFSLSLMASLFLVVSLTGAHSLSGDQFATAGKLLFLVCIHS